MCVTALANLQQAALREDGRTLFSLAKDVVPWIEMHWEGMTTMARRTTHSWKQTVGVAAAAERSVVAPSVGYWAIGTRTDALQAQGGLIVTPHLPLQCICRRHPVKSDIS